MDLLIDVLKHAGLDQLESQTYIALLDNGPLSVLELSKRAELKRTNLYNVLTSLEHKNLVKKDSKAKNTKYVPNPPQEVAKLLEYREQLVLHAKLNFDILLNSLNARYYLSENKPIIDCYEGLNGLQRLYDDVNDTGKDILLFRSFFDTTNKEIKKLTAKQIVSQVKRGIHARVINPIKSSQLEEAKELYTKYDKLRLVEERFLLDSNMELPSQILIYGNKTSMTSVREDVITTIIDNEDITNTLRMLFEYIWLTSTPGHDEIIHKWRA